MRSSGSLRRAAFSLGIVHGMTERASDAERDAAVGELREQLLRSRLTLEEFGERVEQALSARTRAELARVQDELPAGRATRRRPARATAAIFGRVTRRGRLRLRRRTLVLSVFADIDLDLREAEIERARTTVTIVALFGNVDLYVPEGIDVDVGGLTVVGHRREWGRDLARPGAPAVRVRILGVFGTVDVWRVAPGMRGGYGDLIRQLREQQRQLPAG